MENLIPVNQLPHGTVVEVLVPVGFLEIPHQGVLQCNAYGQPIVHQNSKRHGQTVTTSFAEFSEGRPVRVIYVPATSAESAEITRRARADVARGIRWTVGDNCQDFVSRAVLGTQGSKTRDGAVVLSLIGIILGVALSR